MLTNATKFHAGSFPMLLMRCFNYRNSHTSSRPQFWGVPVFFIISKEFLGRYTASATAQGYLCLQSRGSGMPASASTSRTRSTCRVRPCLVNMCFTCVRIVLSFRPIAAAIHSIHQRVPPKPPSRLTFGASSRSTPAISSWAGPKKPPAIRPPESEKVLPVTSMA